MKLALKSVIKLLYNTFIHLPVVRRAIVRAAATVSTEMNVFADFVEGGFGEQYGVTSWQEVLREPAPGFVGSGCGLPLGPKDSSLGYIRKSRQSDARWGNEVSWLDSLLQVVTTD